MTTVNYLSSGEGTLNVNYSLNSLGIKAREGEEKFVSRFVDNLISSSDFSMLEGRVKCIGVTARFKDVIRTFDSPEGETPAGFRIESVLDREGLLSVDLVRDISYDKNGVKRPTGMIFSADSANPYEVAPIAPLLGNLTCNPGIVYDLFINNPKANVGGKFKTRDEVMSELGRVLGAGCDISVELNNPFEKDFDKILEECERFKEILSEYRLVVKVPHMGPVNAENVGQLLSGNKKLDVRYDVPTTEDAFRSHELALKLRKYGYRVNYTLMFEPYQAALALQARPYFINCFLRHRYMQSQKLAQLLKNYDMTSDERYLEDMRNCLLDNDYLSSKELGRSYADVLNLVRDIVSYRRINDSEGSDGLDEARHCLRLLRNTNMRDTKLIICSMEGPYNYPDIDRLMADPEYQDVIDRVVITAEPSYLARFTSTNQVISYQRRFMNAAAGQK